MVEYSIEITERARRNIDDAFDYIAFHLENYQAAYDLTAAIYSSIGGTILRHPFSQAIAMQSV